MGGKKGLGSTIGTVAGLGMGGPAGAIFGNVAGGALDSAFAGMDTDKPGRELAKAAGAAAMAQLAQAQKNYANVERIGGEMTTQGLAGYDKALSAQEKNIARQEQMISQIDPTILEASNQALRLLRGQASSTLSPIENQRKQQRAQLLNMLREQMGPGAETSTAGIQALNNFDMQTNSLLSQQQQSALGQLGQTFGQFSSYAPQLNQSIGQFADITGARAGLQQNFASMLNSAAQPLYQSAGAPYVATQLRAQQKLGNAQQMQQLGGALLGSGLSAMMSRAPSAPAGGGTASAPQSISGQGYTNYAGFTA